ncbi:hypothetical protein C0991_009875 [Blastosporella zonata]|nr:hypothetical protein C0991_009875 [Blastosporella zonata]
MEGNPLPLDTIRTGYYELGRQVDVALRTQRGDAARLSRHRQDCFRLLNVATQHAVLFSAGELNTIQDSVHRMIECLDGVTQQSSDPPQASFPSTSSRVPTGHRGPARVEIDPNILALGLELRGPTHLAAVFNCNPRTIRRRALELGLVNPGAPVYIDYEQDDGSVVRIYRSSAGASSSLSDQELDEIIAYILEAFPSFGRRMIDGHLKHLGHRVPRSCIQAAYTRVFGLPSNCFGPRKIERRVYSVPGPNSLWHHDGQHGLIRWKIVMHAFIDGFSRFVTGIRASNNNLSETVLQVFQDAMDAHGMPSRMRGDHGTENVLVAQLIEELQGIGRGSYIWGRSVHNIRIERLWRDVTLGFGAKWKDFFRGLEVHDGLDINSDAHIWLLHYLFLDDLNQDAMDWANAWNEHVLSIRGERQRSPKDMFVFGMIHNGVRGLEVGAEPSPLIDLSEFGIDWDDYNSHHLREHHDSHNTPDGDPLNPFQMHLPHYLSHVEVPQPASPFSVAHFECFVNHIGPLQAVASRNMISRRQLWTSTLQLCHHIYGTAT